MLTKLIRGIAHTFKGRDAFAGCGDVVDGLYLKGLLLFEPHSASSH